MCRTSFIHPSWAIPNLLGFNVPKGVGRLVSHSKPGAQGWSVLAEAVVAVLSGRRLGGHEWRLLTSRKGGFCLLHSRRVPFGRGPFGRTQDTASFYTRHHRKFLEWGQRTNALLNKGISVEENFYCAL